VETTKQELTGILSMLNDIELKQVLDIVKIIMPSKAIPVVKPDEIDLAMIEEIKTNPDCKERISGADAYAELGWE